MIRWMRPGAVIEVAPGIIEVIKRRVVVVRDACAVDLIESEGATDGAFLVDKAIPVR